MWFPKLVLVIFLSVVGIILFNNYQLRQLVKDQRTVQVVEILEMEYRQTSFKGSDGETYTVYQGSYKPGDQMDCRFFGHSDPNNNCIRSSYQSKY